MAGSKVKPALPGGFNDFGPKDALERERLLGEVLSVFRRYGFVPLETPIVEFREVLVGQAGETEKEIFDLSSKGEEKTLSLRFDLTVGLARYVAAHPELTLPFKRYQVGHVFRGEKPQAGRYRQFLQVDIDTVGAKSVLAEAEILAAMREAIEVFSPGEFYFRINHRGILEGLCKKAGIKPRGKIGFEEQAKQLMRILDKLEKIGLEEVLALLAKPPESEFDPAPALSQAGIELVQKFLEPTPTPLEHAKRLVGDEPEAAAAISQLGDLLEYLHLWKLPSELVRIDLSVARGLDYYTGTVFETVVVDHPQWGSVMSGGRYDHLVERFAAQPIPAVGGSIGFDRFYRLLYQSEPPEISEVDAVVMVFEDRFLPRCLEFVHSLHQIGISAEIPLGGDRSFKGQMTYALKRGAKYLVIFGDGEEEKGVVAVKNLRTRKQVELPLENWIERIKEV